MSETYPRKNHCETLFAGHTPPSVGIGCKGSEKFAIVQENSDFFAIFSLEDAPRRYCLEFRGATTLAKMRAKCTIKAANSMVKVAE